MKGKRKICWPVFDRACLEGGCGYCADGRFILWDTILREVKRRDKDSNSGDAPLWERSYRYGEHSPNIVRQEAT